MRQQQQFPQEEEPPLLLEGSAENTAEPRENAKTADVFASTEKTDGPTAVNTIANSQEEFVGRLQVQAGAPAAVGLASGPTAVRRIAAGQEECAVMGSVLARLARAHGLDVMFVRRIARMKAGNVGMVSAPASVE